MTRATNETTDATGPDQNAVTGSHGDPAGHPSPPRRPDFFVIGAMKAGTTTLHAYLARHPGVFLCDPKEPQFFSTKFDRGFAWYESLFRGAGPDQLCGDCSTCYSRRGTNPEAVERIAAHCPNARLVYVLRHPVDRCYSHYGHRMQEWIRHDGREVIPFEDYLTRDEEAMDASMYLHQIRRFLDFFPRDRLCVVFFEDLTSSPETVHRKILSFLDLAEENLADEGQIAVNKRGEDLARSKINGRLRALRRIPGLRAIARLIPEETRTRLMKHTARRLARSKMGERIGRDFRRTLPPLTPETRTRLLKEFEGPNRALAEFLGQELPANWWT